MQRKIIKIEESLCDGCGDCITSCAEGALQLVDGKAKLVNEMFCDGFGDCVGTCPTGAMIVETREAEDFDEEATKQNLLKTEGKEAVRKMEKAQAVHKQGVQAPHGEFSGCPGSAMRQFDAPPSAESLSGNGHLGSELRQWPIQLHLVQPGMPFFQNKEIVVMNTCGPLASANVHREYLRNRSIVIGCPKLDNTEPYAEKLGMILRDPSIPRVIVVRME
ncbi:MAG: 4Fe-4S ferredoxin, partial [bacterium]|nr:4Fe-4S ferredoxin [bacterium]